MPAKLDLTGQRFGRLTTLSPERRAPYLGWLCLCDCGTTTWVRTGDLRNNHARSCGCLSRETTAKRAFRHGHRKCRSGRPSTTYGSWADMLKRCENPNHARYSDYGGDGIRVCPEWHDFTAFLRDMGECPPGRSIDRIDNDGDYEPGNCRWATVEDQNNNSRQNRRITAFGKTQTLAQWSREVGIPWGTLRRRLVDLNWPPERALTEPVKRLTT